MTKAELRKEIKARMAALSPEELQKQSENLCKKIIASKSYINCTTLLAYMPLPDEADIRPVISDALNKKKLIFMPRITAGTNQMEFYGYDSSTKASKGSFGITEPEADEARNLFRYFDHSKEAQRILMLVPGRAFTKDGRRLGRGKGFYDIYFSRLAVCGFYKSIKKSGVCLACQLVADLPVTPDDILMDDVFYGDFDTPLRGTQSPFISGE